MPNDVGRVGPPAFIHGQRTGLVDVMTVIACLQRVWTHPRKRAHRVTVLLDLFTSDARANAGCGNVKECLEDAGSTL